MQILRRFSRKITYNLKSQIFMYNLFFVSCSVCSDFMLYSFYLFFAHVEIPTLLISIVFLSISLCKMDNFRCQDTITDLTFPTSSCELGRKIRNPPAGYPPEGGRSHPVFDQWESSSGKQRSYQTIRIAFKIFF